MSCYNWTSDTFLSTTTHAADGLPWHSQAQIVMTTGHLCENRQKFVNYGKAQMQVRNTHISNTANRMILENKISGKNTKKVSRYTALFTPWAACMDIRSWGKYFEKGVISLFKTIHLYIRPSSWKNSSPNWWIFVKYIWKFFENLSR
jgi:hypothetical protein